MIIWFLCSVEMLMFQFQMNSEIADREGLRATTETQIPVYVQRKDSSMIAFVLMLYHMYHVSY